jgi:hypothetical protein
LGLEGVGVEWGLGKVAVLGIQEYNVLIVLFIGSF